MFLVFIGSCAIPLTVIRNTRKLAVMLLKFISNHERGWPDRIKATANLKVAPVTSNIVNTNTLK